MKRSWCVILWVAGLLVIGMGFMCVLLGSFMTAGWILGLPGMLLMIGGGLAVFVAWMGWEPVRRVSSRFDNHHTTRYNVYNNIPDRR